MATGQDATNVAISTVCHEHISEGGDVELYKRWGLAPRGPQSVPAWSPC